MLSRSHLVRPDPSARADENWVPRWPDPIGAIKQNKELPQGSDCLTAKSSRGQVGQSGIAGSLTCGLEVVSLRGNAGGTKSTEGAI